MTDKEIIKALECCISPECDNYPYDGDDLLRPCNHNLMKDALDLINRQQAEVERLQKENNQFADIGKMYSEIRAEAIKEFWEKLWELDPEIISKVVSLDLGELNNLKKEMMGEDR